MTEISRFCLKLQDEINSIRMRIAELKNERLCNCGRIVALDANFCQTCGRKLEDAPRGATVAPSSAGYSQRKEDAEETRVYGEGSNRVQAPEPEYQINYQEVAEDEEELPLPLEGYAESLQESRLDQQQADELERERERQLELDRRIRFWKESEFGETEGEAVSGQDLVKCQICRADLPKGSLWCPRCGSEQI